MNRVLGFTSMDLDLCRLDCNQQEGEAMSNTNGPQELHRPEPNASVVATRNNPPQGNSRHDHTGAKVPPGLVEALPLVALLVAYAVFLILGTFVHTTQLVHVREFFVLLTCWTWTNLLILCCLSSVIGEQGRRALFGKGPAPRVQAALVRGFLILLVVMAGQLVVLGTPAPSAVPGEMIHDKDLLLNVCLAHFVRLAAASSLLSLVVALQPDLIRVIINHILAGMVDGNNKSHPAEPQPN
jgi:hypothetical protein